MPAGVAPPNFHGNKNSGRKSARDEFLRNRVIEKAWNLKDIKMADNEAIQIVIKDMAAKTELGGKVQVEQITGVRIVKDGTGIQNKD